ncbi:MAG: cyclic nucleotide-binding domain-containing protein [Chloroflexota bacterium]
MRSIEDLVAELPTFAGLDPDQRELIAGCGSNRVFEAGEHLAREGDAADTFFAIRHGRIALELVAPGRGPLMIATIGAGSVVGWSWLFPPYRWSFDARALERVRAVAFDGACLRGKCEDDKALGYELMRRFTAIMLERLQATRLQLLDVYGGSGGK